jgi:hypothetical protein
LLNTRIVLIEMEQAGTPVYWVGTEIRFASMLLQNDCLYWRWETNKESILSIMETIFLKPQEVIADLDEMKNITGFQLKNLIFNCRIVVQ